MRDEGEDFFSLSKWAKIINITAAAATATDTTATISTARDKIHLTQPCNFPAAENSSEQWGPMENSAVFVYLEISILPLWHRQLKGHLHKQCCEHVIDVKAHVMASKMTDLHIVITDRSRDINNSSNNNDNNDNLPFWVHKWKTAAIFCSTTSTVNSTIPRDLTKLKLWTSPSSRLTSSPPHYLTTSLPHHVYVPCT